CAGASRHETPEHIALAVRQTREAALDVTALSLTLLVAITSIERRPYGGEENLVLERLFQKINGAQSHRFHGEGNVPMSGDNDDWRSDLELAQSPQEVDAAELGHPHIGDDAARLDG